MKVIRWFKRMWRLANPDIVQVKCNRCYDMIDVYDSHDCLFSR